MKTYQDTPYFLSTSPYVEPEQRRSFDYFSHRTVPQLSGLFSTRFWGKDLLQASYHNGTLRYAIVALGSLHERFEQSDPTIFRSNKDLVQGGFALQQYVLAISSLAKPSDGSPRVEVDVYLIACLLFASFEMLRGHHGSAIQHVHCGVRILAEVAAESIPGAPQTVSRPKNPLVPIETLAIMFARLDVQAQQLLGFSVYPPGLAKVWQLPEEHFCEEVPHTFPDIDSARNSFEYPGVEINRVLVDPPNSTMSLKSLRGFDDRFEKARLEVLDRMERWKEALERTLASPPQLWSPQDVWAGQLLMMMGTLVVIALTTAGSVSEMIFDNYTDDYRRAVDLAGEVAEKASRTAAGASISQPRFQMDMGIVVSMFETIRKCRDRVVRRKAIAILESHPWQEGLWDGTLIARAVKELIFLEGDGDYVPEWARVGEIHMQFDREERCAHLQLGQTNRLVEGRPLYTARTFRW